MHRYLQTVGKIKLALAPMMNHWWQVPLLLPYEAVRTAGFPREALLEFCHSTYEAGAQLSGWTRASLERRFIRPHSRPR